MGNEPPHPSLSTLEQAAISFFHTTYGTSSNKPSPRPSVVCAFGFFAFPCPPRAERLANDVPQFFLISTRVVFHRSTSLAFSKLSSCSQSAT